MSKAYPYFQWYPADAENDERYASMTDQELGFYHRLLNKSWSNFGLPADMDELARLMRVSREYLDAMWKRVGECFVLSDAVRPRLVNPRQEREREKAIAKSAALARPKNQNAVREKRNCVSSAFIPRSIGDSSAFNLRNSAFLRASDSVSVSEQVETASEDREAEKPKALRKVIPLGSRFQEWADGFSRVGSADFAYQAWISYDSDEQFDAAAACRDRYMESDEVARGAVMDAAKFIHQQAPNGWSGKWPKARAAPKRMSTAESMLERAEEIWREQEANGRV